MSSWHGPHHTLQAVRVKPICRHRARMAEKRINSRPTTSPRTFQSRGEIRQQKTGYGEARAEEERQRRESARRLLGGRRRGTVPCLQERRSRRSTMTPLCGEPASEKPYQHLSQGPFVRQGDPGRDYGNEAVLSISGNKNNTDNSNVWECSVSNALATPSLSVP